MATEILKSFGALQSELEQAKTSLRGVDENIKRLIGRDPSEFIPPNQQRHLKRAQTGGTDDSGIAKPRLWGLGGGRRVFAQNSVEPPPKRRGGVFNRLSERSSGVPEKPAFHEDDSNEYKSHRLISKVIVTPKEVPSRQEALDAQSGDEQVKARNRRMFGALLGTLQKFQQEETKLKPKEEKRAQLEKKIEEIEIREKAEIKKERQELFQNRKQKQAEIKMIELKMQKMKAYAQWEDLQKHRMHFSLTNCKPRIHYLPKKMNESAESALAATKEEITKIIEERKQEVSAELQVIEEKMKWHQKKDVPTTAENGSGKRFSDGDDNNDDDDDETDGKVKEEDENDDDDNENEPPASINMKEEQSQEENSQTAVEDVKDEDESNRMHVDNTDDQI